VIAITPHYFSISINFFQCFDFQVMDIRDARIDSLLQEIINTNLCEVPRDEPWTVEQFEKRTAVCISKKLLSFRNKCKCNYLKRSEFGLY